MENENLMIEIEGQEAEDIYPDLLNLEVELDEELAAMFKLQLASLQQPDGTWSYLDDDRFMVWKKVTISAGFSSGMEELIDGYITHVRPYFDLDPAQCKLEVWGMDGSCLLDREEKLKDWPNKKDSDIAAEIFNAYGLAPEVEDTTIVHDEAVSTIIQRETDMQFLQRLAVRNGYECYIQEGKGYFRSPQLNGTPQAVLAAHFGDETNIDSLSFEVDGLKATEVAMVQIDRAEKSVLQASAATSQQTSLGQNDTVALLPSGVDPAKIYVGMNVATGNPEMTALCAGLFHDYSWFVAGEGKVDANKYGNVLKTRQTVTIKGVGETYSGVYYVTHVTHTFAAEGYTQRFKVKRNALMPTGSEQFSASGSSGGLL
ncbi:MAG: Phage late control gene D protein (GPD) [Syntrophorhabdus sp. PtaU1.Bin153]|nr:MAG: Phage late control gene D protein (GPD) [Syntrophorhabdus sp. PtaU1.Bin153]